MAQATEIDNLVVRLGLDGRAYSSGLKKASAETVAATTQINRSFAVMAARVSGSLKSVGASATTMGRTLALRLTAPLAIVGGLGVRAFAKFDNAMIESTSIMKVTAEQAQRMRQAALDLSREAVQGPEQLAESYFFLASAGKDAEQSMALLPQVAKFATAGAFDMALATDLLTDAQSALGLSSKNVAEDTENLVRLSDILVRSNTLANASVQQFSEALTADAATASKSLGAELETTVALLLLYGDKGKKAAEAGNLFGRATRLLTSSFRENASEFETRNIRVIDQATGEYRNFIDILDDMNKAFAGLKKPQRDAALDALGFAALAQKAILPLLDSTEQLKMYERELRNAGGTTDDVANKQLKSFSNQMKIAWNNVKVFAIGIGEILAPMLSKVADFLKDATVWWDRFSDGTKRAIVIVGVVLASIGPLLLIFGGLTTAIGFALAGLSTFITVAGTVIGALLSPIAIVTAAVIGLGVWVLFYTETGGAALNWFGRQWERLKERVGPAIQGITDAIKAGEFALAFEIAMLEIKITFFETIAPIERAWIIFSGTFSTAWQKATDFIVEAWQKTVGAIAKGTIALNQALGSKLGKGLNARLGKVLAITAKGVGKAILPDIAKLSGKVLRDTAIVDKRIIKLREQRDKKIQEAADKLRDKTTDKLKQDPLPVPVLPEFPDLPDMPTLTIPVKFGLVSTTVVGSAEALAELEGIARQATRATRTAGAGRAAPTPTPRPGGVDVGAAADKVFNNGDDIREAIDKLFGVNERTAEASETLVADNEESVPLGIGGI